MLLIKGNDEWSVHVNGGKADMVIMNRLFQKVMINAPDTHKVTFKYRLMLTITLLLLPYLVLSLCLVICLLYRLQRYMVR